MILQPADSRVGRRVAGAHPGSSGPGLEEPRPGRGALTLQGHSHPRSLTPGPCRRRATSSARLWEVGGRQGPRAEPTQTWGEHPHSPQTVAPAGN